ncbi:hypothetical protein RIF29_03684 [Crotalaria pallida]|uniref:Uncharacterized protein n=1 Tax=Crotalaria pallida TaxID=3830 RepID=A0AAN9J2N0_CROPI
MTPHLGHDCSRKNPRLRRSIPHRDPIEILPRPSHELVVFPPLDRSLSQEPKTSPVYSPSQSNRDPTAAQSRFGSVSTDGQVIGSMTVLKPPLDGKTNSVAVWIATT